MQVPELDPACLRVLARLRALERSPPEGKDPVYDAEVWACLEALRAQLPGAFEGLLERYRSLPRPGDLGDQRVRAALLYVLPEAGRRELDVEVSARLLDALRTPGGPEAGDLEFLIHAARRASDPAAYLPLAKAMVDLPTLEARESALQALAWKPLPDYLPFMEALWAKDGSEVAGALEVALKGLSGKAGLELLERMTQDADARIRVLDALVQRDCPEALDIVLKVCHEGPRRKEALERVASMCVPTVGYKPRYAAGYWPGLLGHGVEVGLVDARAGIAQGASPADIRPGLKIPEPAKVRRIAIRLEALADPAEDEDYLIQLCQTLGRLRCGSSLNALSYLAADARPKLRAASLKAREAVLEDPR